MKSHHPYIAIKNIRHKKLRSWLTLIGILISIAIIFILVSLSVGLQVAVEEQFRLLGTDKFFIIPGRELSPPGSTSSITLTEKDVTAIEKVPGVKDVSSFVAGNAKVEFKKEIRYRYIMGIKEEDLDLYMESGSLKIEEGTKIKDKDLNKVLVGYDYASGRMFKRQVELADKIEINDHEFKVTGILQKIGNPDDDKSTFIPLEKFKEIFKTGDRVDYIIVQINEGEDLKQTAEKIEKKLRSVRNVNEKTQDFSILTPEEIMATFNSILRIITIFLIGIAGISLLVGGIGIANTMYTSVLERFREIGVMKAVGARNSDILKLFILEAGMLGLVGGIMGVLLGFGISKIIELIAIEYVGTNLLKASAPLYLIIGCILFSSIIGMISGALPAIQASKIKPVEALRYE